MRGLVFPCLLAYYPEWHLRWHLEPLLFEEEDRSGARALRISPVEKAQVSEHTKTKAARKQTADGLPVQCLQALLADLRTLTLSQVTLADAPERPFPIFAKPMLLQAKAFGPLDLEIVSFSGLDQVLDGSSRALTGHLNPRFSAESSPDLCSRHQGAEVVTIRLLPAASSEVHPARQIQYFGP